MTTTNRAFIKAYRQDEPQPAPATPAIAGPARPATVEQAAASAAARSALYGPPPVLHGSHDPARAATEVPPSVENIPAVGTVSRSGGRPQRLSPPGEKRPLSSFIAATGIARLSNEPAETDFFRPGTTVASFHWPAVCRALSRQCGEQLSRVADLLVTHGAAGRSLVGVLGLHPGVGATTIALCLAARLAERRRRVILADGNFHHPQLATLLEAEPTAGWQDVLKHGAPLTDAVIRATDDRLDLLALGAQAPADALRLVAGLQAVVTAGVLRHAYDHVLIDAGAFLDSASRPVVFELMRNMGIDAVVAITGPGSTEARDIATLADHLGRSGCELLGTIENRQSREPRVKSREPDLLSGS